VINTVNLGSFDTSILTPNTYPLFEDDRPALFNTRLCTQSQQLSPLTPP
jgi:hypothetical protein